MNWLDAFKFIMKFLPCIINLFKELAEAKKDDGEVDMGEIIKIAENFFTCVTSKLDIKK